MILFVERHPRFSMVAFCLLALLVLWIYMGSRINHWQVVNMPPQGEEVVCFGDSLVYGVGAETAEQTYPAQLQALLSRPVIAYGYSGATTDDGLGILRETPGIDGAVVIVTLGGNDALQRVAFEERLENLGAIFTILQERGAVVVFTGVPNGYTSPYRELCKQYGVVLVPKVLKGILGDRSLKADQIHPNAKGYRLMAERVAQVLKEDVF